MSRNTAMTVGTTVKLVIPAILIGLSACSGMSNDNTATRDMIVRFSELGLPKDPADTARATDTECTDAAQMARPFAGLARRDFSRCPARKVAGSNGGAS